MNTFKAHGRREVVKEAMELQASLLRSTLEKAGRRPAR